MRIARSSKTVPMVPSVKQVFTCGAKSVQWAGINDRLPSGSVSVKCKTPWRWIWLKTSKVCPSRGWWCLRMVTLEGTSSIRVVYRGFLRHRGPRPADGAVAREGPGPAGSGPDPSLPDRRGGLAGWHPRAYASGGAAKRLAVRWCWWWVLEWDVVSHRAILFIADTRWMGLSIVGQPMQYHQGGIDQDLFDQIGHPLRFKVFDRFLIHDVFHRLSPDRSDQFGGRQAHVFGADSQ